MKKLLSKKAIRLLEDNGYKYKQSNRVITFMRPFDYVSIIVVTVLIIIISFPLFIFNTFLAILTLVLGFGGLIARYTYFSKRMKFIIDLDTQKFHFTDNEIELNNQSLSYASKIILHSQFKDEYTSSFKTTSEEHRITIRLELLSGSSFTCFRFHSDFAKPSQEVLEVYKLLKKLIKWTKKKKAGQSDPDTVSI